MKTPNGGQSSHTPGDDRKTESPRRWHDVRSGLVWEFAVDLCTRRNLREVARMVKLSPETVRKFVNRIGVANLATRRRFAELYLEFNAEGVMAEEVTLKPWKARPRLIELLPPGKLKAREAIVRLFELAQRFPDEAPGRLDELHDWMDLQVCGEYWAEGYYGAIGRGEREHDEHSFLANIPRRIPQKRQRRVAADE